MRKRRIMGILFVALAVLVAGILLLAHDRALKLTYPPRTHAATTPTDFGLTPYEDVHFRTSDGLTLTGWFLPPADGSDRAVIVYLHGFGGNRAEMLPQAAMMARYGYGALLFDLRNSGDSEGTITTFGYLEALDAAGAVDFLLARADVNPDRIALVGVSLGAAAAIRAAAVVPQVRAVVSESAFSSLQDNVAEGVRRLVGLPPFPFAPLVVWFAEREVGQSMDAIRPMDDIDRIAPRPLLLIHGSDDGLIAVGNAQRLFDAAGEPKTLWIVPGGHHSDLIDVAPEAFEAHLTDFLNTSLRG